MNRIKKGLGRGLSSLIGETKVETKTNKLSLSEIVPNKYQPRKNFDEENLEDLTNSIKQRGVIQPIIVRRSNSKYEIIAGERRWLAARRAGLHDIPVVVTEADDLKSLEFAIVENVQRHDLNPLEEAQGYKRLIDEFSYDQEKVSRFIGKSRSYITNTLRLLNLPEEVLKLVENKKITAFAGIGNPTNFFDLLKSNNLNINKTYSFPDHYNYSTKDFEILNKEKSNILLTTEKDYYRINNDQRKICDFIEVDLEIENQELFKNIIKSSL